jgi:hypothetical protein
MKMTKRKTKSVPAPEKFLIKRMGKLFLVPPSVLENFSPIEAFQIAIDSHFEQRAQLLIDAHAGDHYVDETKVVDGLEASLRKFEALFPSIKEHLQYVDQSSRFSKIGKS